MKEIIYQLKAVKESCLANNLEFNASVLDTCIGELHTMDSLDADKTKWLVNKDNYIKKLQDELTYVAKERDAAIADITEFAKFNQRRTICDFCKHDCDSDETCRKRRRDNVFINVCFEWRGL